MSKAASQDLMELLHSMYAQRLMDILKRDDGATSAELGVIRQFLKDNNITAAADATSVLSALDDALRQHGVEVPDDVIAETEADAADFIGRHVH